MKKNLVFILSISILFSSVVLFADWQKLSSRGKKNLRSANMHSGGERFEKAIPLYMKVLDENPHHIETLNRLAGIYFDAKRDYLEAHKYYVKMIEITDSIYAEYKSIKSRDEKAAEEFFEDNIEDYDLEQLATNSKKFKGYCWTKLFLEAQEEFTNENFQVAAEKYKELYKLAPDSSKTVKMLSYTHKKLGDSEKSMEYMLKSAELESKDDMVRTQIANIYFQKENFEEAIKWYQEASNINPENLDNFYNLAICYTKTENDSGAFKAFKKVVEFEPENINAIINTSNYAAKIGNNSESIKYLKMAVDIDPKNVSYYQFLCYKLFQEKMFKDLLKYSQVWYKLDDSKQKEIAQLIYRAAVQVGDKEIEKKFEKILTDLK